jgi:uncharacterized membrane protein YkvA (DUF1232 family)
MARNKKSRSGVARVLNLAPFMPLAGRAPMYGRLLWALARDPRVPVTRKAVLALAGLYIVSPIDLVPERIPFLGAVDDVAVMVLAIDVFLEGLPDELLKEKLDELGIPQSELDSDLKRVRRMVPKPLRSMISRVPAFLDRVGAMVGRSLADTRGARKVNSEVISA